MQDQVISYRCDDCGRQVRDGASLCLRCATVRVLEECGGDCTCMILGYYISHQCASRAGKLAGDRREPVQLPDNDPDDGRL